MSAATPSDRVGVYCIGARGAIGVATLSGLLVLEEGVVRPGGMVSEHPPFDALPFRPWRQWVVGGCDLERAPLLETFEGHLRSGIIPAADRGFVRAGLADAEQRIDSVAELAASVANAGGHDGTLTGKAVVAELRALLRAFKAQHEVDRLIVLSVCSTEPQTPEGEALRDLDSWDELDAALARPTRELPWGPLYAAAALLEDCAFVNFTPNLGSDLPALSDLATRRRLPHAGKDGKTGETLLKSVLAPMFHERDLEVLAWQGYNLLGNNDGRTLSDPRARAAKIASKDRQLRALLPRSAALHTGVGIDYVPSLGDFKTAWDYVHFRGFLGVSMSFQFVWNGCDTALAAPLVLELLRFTDLAWRRGEVGHLSHLDAYFKSPTGSNEHDFRHQMARLRGHFAPEAVGLGEPCRTMTRGEEHLAATRKTTDEVAIEPSRGLAEPAHHSVNDGS